MLSFEHVMANSLTIVLVLATIAHSSLSQLWAAHDERRMRMMNGEWASKVCAAYYKASELGAYNSRFGLFCLFSRAVPMNHNFVPTLLP